MHCKWYKWNYVVKWSQSNVNDYSKSILVIQTYFVIGMAHGIPINFKHLVHSIEILVPLVNWKSHLTVYHTSWQKHLHLRYPNLCHYFMRLASFNVIKCYKHNRPLDGIQQTIATHFRSDLFIRIGSCQTTVIPFKWSQNLSWTALFAFAQDHFEYKMLKVIGFIEQNILLLFTLL